MISDIIVIGAGVIGSSVAMNLAQLGVRGVRVLDFDLEGHWSSSELNAGGVRATWNQPLNISLSMESIKFFEIIHDRVGFQSCGYLWLKSENNLAQAQKTRQILQDMGWPVEEWSFGQLSEKIPFLNKQDNIAGIFFSRRDGLINTNSLKNYFRDEAQRAGVVFEDGVRVVGAEYSEGSAAKPPVKLRVEKFRVPISTADKRKVLVGEKIDHLSISHIDYFSRIIVNCAGPWASNFSKVLGYHSPSYPLRRQMSLFDCREVDLTPYGMIVDTSGVYFHPEGGYGLAGVASADENPGFNFEYDAEDFFHEKIWLSLYQRSTYFERLKHIRGWAGLYEVSPDETAIIGRVTLGNPGKSGNVFECHSFSGHGVMQSYAAGRALAELIVFGKYKSIDVSALCGDRFEHSELGSVKLLSESLVI